MLILRLVLRGRCYSAKLAKTPRKHQIKSPPIANTGRKKDFYKEKYGAGGWFWQTPEGELTLGDLELRGNHSPTPPPPPPPILHTTFRQRPQRRPA